MANSVVQISPQPKMHRKNSKTIWSNTPIGYIFILPALLLLTLFMYRSFFMVVKQSFYLWNGFDVSTAKYIGIDNYLRLFKDKNFYTILRNSLGFAGFATFFNVFLGFGLATILSLRIRGKRFFSTIFFFPSVVSGALMAVAFTALLDRDFGTLNGFLKSIGADFLVKDYLGTGASAFTTVGMISAFFIGTSMLFYMAGISSIDGSIMEAAAVDGANLMTIATKIMFPMLSNVHKTITVTAILTAFRSFDLIWLLTRGGPGYSTEVAGTYVYKLITETDQVSYGVAMSTVLIAIALLLSIVQIKMYDRKA